jgi:hypothetical protein
MGKHCEAVELLLARMDSNPEEFTQGGRWEKLIVRYRSCLPMQDRLAMEDKLNTLWLEVFHKDVMNELLAEPREVADYSEEYKRTSGTRPGVIPLQVPVGGITTAISPYTNALTSNGTSNTSTLTNVGAGSPTLNLSNQSIKDIAAQLQQYAANMWRP